jgi:exosortase K
MHIDTNASINIASLRDEEIGRVLSQRKWIDQRFPVGSYRSVAQLVVVLLCAAAVKQYYSTSSVNQLRWILAPTTWLVEFISGTDFAFESYTGYMSSDHTFVIAASCAGVNFLITSFLMLSLRRLWRDRASKISWSFFAGMAAVAYLVTIFANAMRISSSLLMRRTSWEIGLSANQMHRFEGIFIYFGFLLLLFLVSERVGQRGSMRATDIRSATGRLMWHSLFPLLIYYVTILAIPLANGAYRQGPDFREHALFVLVTPLLVLVPVIVLQLYRQQISQVGKGACPRILQTDPNIRITTRLK